MCFAVFAVTTIRNFGMRIVSSYEYLYVDIAGYHLNDVFGLSSADASEKHITLLICNA